MVSKVLLNFCNFSMTMSIFSSLGKKVVRKWKLPFFCLRSKLTLEGAGDRGLVSCKVEGEGRRTIRGTLGGAGGRSREEQSSRGEKRGKRT